MKTYRNPGLCSAQGICRLMVNGTVQGCRGGGSTYPERYIILRSVTKSDAVSEDRIRGQPFGDSAAARLA